MHSSPTPGPLSLRVSIAGQRMDLLDGDRLVRSYPVSTSRFGLGTEEGSHRTPLGRFVIGEKIGGGLPRGTIFVGRQPVGRWEPGGDDTGDLILSRILWLEGNETANANTRERYIYIHGTHEENRIGSPASHGCIRMRNDDVIELFEAVEVGTTIVIDEDFGLADSGGEKPGPSFPSKKY